MNIKPQKTEISLQKYIFDPLSTIIKLAVLKNKSIGTKISIMNNIIYIQEIGMFQSLVRYYNGNNKTDIHYLSIPIELACAKYLTNEMILQIPDIMILFICAQDGLTNLMKTYVDYPIIVHCLKYYYSIIETHINEQICDKNCILKQKNNKIPLVIIKSNSHILNSNMLTRNKNKIKSNQNIDILNKSVSDKSISDKSISDKSISDKSISDKSISDKSISDKSISDKSISDKSISDEDVLDKISLDDDELISNEKIIVDSKVELIELYTNELLEKFYNIWSISKITIILGMIKYLLAETSPVDYVKCIETFIIPIDKDIYDVIHL
jgi:hypothetical protein